MSAPKSAPPEILLRVETAELELGYPAGGVQLPPDEFRKLDLLLARPPLPHALRRVQVLIRVYEPLPEADLIELARQRASRLEIHLLKKGIKPASIRIESLLTPWVQPKDCGKKKSASICQPPQSTVRITLVPER